MNNSTKYLEKKRFTMRQCDELLDLVCSTRSRTLPVVPRQSGCLGRTLSIAGRALPFPSPPDGRSDRPQCLAPPLRITLNLEDIPEIKEGARRGFEGVQIEDIKSPSLSQGEGELKKWVSQQAGAFKDSVRARGSPPCQSSDRMSCFTAYLLVPCQRCEPDNRSAK